MGMLMLLCCVVTLLVTVQSGVAMNTRFVQDSEAVLDQKMFLQLLRRVENLENREQDQQAEIDSLREELNTEKVKTARLGGRLSRLLASLGDWRRTGDKADNNAKTSYGVAMATDDDAGTQSDSRRSEGGEVVRHDQTAESSDDGVRPQTSKLRRQAETPVIAFHATLSQTSAHAGVHQIIAFDRVVTNIGSAYNPHFGSFVAPVSGVYVFNTRVQVFSHSTTQVSMVRNGSSVGQMWINGAEDAGLGSSTMAVLYLSKGDDVAVQSNLAGPDIEGTHYSHFSGFLLHQDDEGSSIVE